MLTWLFLSKEVKPTPDSEIIKIPPFPPPPPFPPANEDVRRSHLNSRFPAKMTLVHALTT